MSAEELRRYEEQWTQNMGEYWRERMMKLKVYDTGALYNSIKGAIRGQVIEHRFLLYGIYVARGTGKYYRKGNGGNLEFLEDWKKNFRKHRQRRDWYSGKYFGSVRRLNETEAKYYGEAYMGLLQTSIETLLKDKEKQTK